MKKLVIAGVVSLVTVFGSSNALAQKAPKCVNPALSVVVHDYDSENNAFALASDGEGPYSDGQRGVYAKMNTCGGTADIVLSLGDLSQRWMSLGLSDGPHVATRVDVTGVGTVLGGACELRFATLWFNDPTGGFVRLNGTGTADTVTVCNRGAKGIGPWTVWPTDTATGARFKFLKGKYQYYQDETVPFSIDITKQ